MADAWEDIKNILRVRKVEGGYESIFNWDGAELVMNFVPFEIIATILEKKLGRKPTPEEVEEEARKTVENPMAALEARPDPPRPGEEGVGEISRDWAKVHRYFGMLERGMMDLKGKMDLKKKKEKEGISQD